MRVYHQGGLDTYCGFYSILNLINFLNFEHKPNVQNAGDFIGAENFANFTQFINAGGFNKFFPTWPFGDKGLGAQQLKDALSHTLTQFNIGATAGINKNRPIGIGELGIAWVMEDEQDEFEHWIVLVGSKHLVGTDIGCENGWTGIVLDSDRGYKFWRCDDQDAHRLCIKIDRNGRFEDKGRILVRSFISVSPGP